MANDESSQSDVGEKTLNETPEKAFRFIVAVADNVGIASALTEVGYGAQEHAKGWELINAVGSASGLFSAGPKAVGNKASAAVAALDSLDEKWFGIASATLRAKHPGIHEAFFDDLAASRGPSAVFGWHTFVTRHDELKAVAEKRVKPRSKGAKKGDEGEATADEQNAARGALAALAARGVTEAFVERMRGLVAEASTLVPVALPSDAERDAKEKKESANTRARRALYTWYREWADIAASVITRRDWLISLGIAERRSAKATDKGEGEKE